MLGKRLKRKPNRGQEDRLFQLLMKMDALIEADQWDAVETTMEEFIKELDKTLKTSYIPETELKRIQKFLAHLEKRANLKKEQLNKQSLELKKLKSYGQF